jgi:gas vesicle protein
MAKSSGSKWALGAAVAGLAGFVAGILTAPKSGKETRTDIKNAALKAKSEAEKDLKVLHSELNKRIGEVRTKGEELSGKAKTEFDVIVEKAKGTKEKVREILSSLHDGDADDPDLKKALKEAREALKALERFAKKPVSTDKK